MPKGKTNQPVVMYIEGDLYNAPEVQKMISMGHTVRHIRQYKPGVILLGEHCFRSTKELIKYLKLAISSARVERYPKKARKTKEAA